MAHNQVLSGDELESALADLSAWRIQADKLHRQFEFADFAEAFGFMAHMAVVSERLNHHPEWSNVWNKVTVELTTHSAGGITRLDLDWARHADAAIAVGH